MVQLRARVVRDGGFAHEIVTLVTERGPLLPLVHYQLSKLNRSLSWHRELLRSIFLLLEFAEANPLLCEKPREFFETFSWRLLVGTIDSQGGDKCGLFWTPKRAALARRITKVLSEFSDYMAIAYEAEQLNPLRAANARERILKMAAWSRRNNEKFLGHLASRSAAWIETGHVRNISLDGAPPITNQIVKAFPEERFYDLVFQGFAVYPHLSDPIQRLNIRDVLITLLLHGGGIRVSEAFNLWVQDVSAVGDIALVRIGHPTEDMVRWRDPAGSICQTTRIEYLIRHGLRPRNLTNGSLHAGWKNPALDRKWHLEVHWSDPEYGRLFLSLWKIYLTQIAPLPRPHPWAWVSMQAGRAGYPLKIGQFHKSHERAIRRIGLNPHSEIGTAPHSHRHSYAKRLVKMGISQKALKQCLHHNSLASQLVYTEATIEEVHQELQRGYSAMKCSISRWPIEAQEGGGRQFQ